jgi:hypothetical protein
MNLSGQCVDRAGSYPVFGDLQCGSEVEVDYRKEESMVENVHSIVMLSLHCFEKLFGTHTDPYEGLLAAGSHEENVYVEKLSQLLEE